MNNNKNDTRHTHTYIVVHFASKSNKKKIEIYCVAGALVSREFGLIAIGLWNVLNANGNGRNMITTLDATGYLHKLVLFSSFANNFSN